jgi:uncharacterized linocin/CFP29 family protein
VDAVDTDQVGWTEAQWNRVREAVLSAWQRVRVAGSFLPVYGPLPAGVKVVPSEVFISDGTVDDQSTASLVEISLPVVLTRQQVRDEGLSSAILQFTRRAMQVGQLEDWYIFNGTIPDVAFFTPTQIATQNGPGGFPSVDYRPDFAFLDQNVAPSVVQGIADRIANPKQQIEGLRQRNPGALGLYYGADQVARPERVPLDDAGSGLIRTVVAATSMLEREGYLGPHVCAFARTPWEAAHEPNAGTLVLPRDRLEPLVGRELLHASALDIPAQELDGMSLNRALWMRRGVLLSLSGEAIDLVIAADATPEFRYINAEGKYVFAVFERFALRIKDPKAVVPLQFAP